MGQTFLRPTIENDIALMNRRLSNLEKSRISHKALSVSVGMVKNADTDFEDIQEAIDYTFNKGGGTVVIKNGEYLVDSDIVIKNGVNLTGESPYGVLIDFQNQAHQIQSKGTELYSTGTITITNRSTTVTGSGTNWTSAYVDKAIIFKGYMAYITAVNSTTSMTIDTKWMKVTEGSLTYNICEEVLSTNMTNISVTNSTHSDGAIFYQYAFLLELSELVAYDSTIGIHIDKTSAVNLEGWEAYGCGTGIKIENCGGGWGMSDGYIVDSTGCGLDMNIFSDCSLNNFSILTCGTHAIKSNNILNLGISDFSLLSNGGVGLYLETNCKDTQILNGNMLYNGNDGIALGSNIDSIIISTNTIKSNTGFGVNITASTCDKNIVLGNSIVSNTAGTVNNAGTATIVEHNQT